MVLHNNKWDRRAKTRYLKKHGIVAGDSKRQDGRNHPLDDESTHSEDTNTTITGVDDHFYDSDQNPATKSAREEESTEGFETIPDFEEDPEQTKLIRDHFAQRTYDKEAKPHIQTVDKSVFEQAQAGTDRSRLNQRVKRIGLNRKTNIDLDSDSDFDGFMDQLDEEDATADILDRTHGSSNSVADKSLGDHDIHATIESRQQFLDGLLK